MKNSICLITWLILMFPAIQNSILSTRCNAIPPDQPDRPARARELGISPGTMEPGKCNAITDVEGVRVGHTTLFRGDSIRTGVTAILPHGGNLYHNKVPAAYVVGNGFGKLAGTTQIRELGNIETPIVLTNTLSVGTAMTAVVKYTLNHPGNSRVRTVNPVVGETNDGYLNHIRGLHLDEEDVFEAIRSASAGPVDEGCVGAGTGTIAFGYKGGIGTSSRLIPTDRGNSYAVGVLVQTNYSGALRIDGKLFRPEEQGSANGRKGKETGLIHPGDAGPQESAFGQVENYSSRDEESRRAGKSSGGGYSGGGIDMPEYPVNPTGEGSCIIIVATDAPITVRNLERLARRSLLGLARTGSFMSNGSGDYVIAFSTGYTIAHGADRTALPPLLSNNSMNPLFRAVVESVEEAVYNSMFMATTTTGYRGRKIRAIPLEYVRELAGQSGEGD